MRFFQKKQPVADDQAASATSHSRAASETDVSEKNDTTKSTPAANVVPALTPKNENALEQRIDGLEPGSGQSGEDETVYPSGVKLLLITVALALSIFCVALDNTIIATAIPKITDDFQAINDVGWYGSAYLLTTCAFQLFFGKLYTFFSIKYVYLAAFLVFEVGSVVCGAAPNSTALIIGRAVAGLGSAGIFSGAVLIIANSVPLRSRAAYTGIFGAMYGVASVAGPLMGGAFTDNNHLTWRWCFYINLPIGVVTFVFVTFFYNPDKAVKSLAAGWKAKLDQFDLIGTAVFLPLVICLLLALQWGGSKYAWNSGNIIALLVVAGVLLIAFIAIQFWKQDNGTVPPRVLKQRSVAASAWFGLMIGSAFFCIVYFSPLWFQAIKSKSPLESGIANLPMLLSVVVLSMVAGGLVTWLGYYTPFMILSSILAAIGAGLMTTWRPDTPQPVWIGYQIIFGAGIGFGMQQTLIAVQTVLPAADVPIGTAIVMFCQTLGGAIFISVAQNIFTNRLLSNVISIVPDLNPSIVLQSGATNLVTAIPAQYLSGVIEAYNDAITTAFYVAVATAALSIFGAVCMEWKSVKGKKIEMAMA